jgi:hypothetical protein
VTENEIRRIPEVYGRDKVKEDVGRAFLHSIQRIVHAASPGRSQHGGTETKGGEV